MKIAKRATYLVAIGLVCGVCGSYSQGPQSHIRAFEAGLGPAVTISDKPVYRQSLLSEMKRLRVPAVSIAVIHDSKIEWAKGYGVADDDNTPVTQDTLFQAASLSKSLTSMAALKMVEQRKLSLDSPVNSELTSWKLPQTSLDAETPVTLRELLSHTGGLSVHGFAGYSAGQTIPTLVQVLRGELPANSPPIVVVERPGTRFMYSGGGYTVIQQMMIDQSGESFPDLMKELVLNPIGMTRSSFRQPLDHAMLKGAAQPFDSEVHPIKGGPHTYPELAAAGLWTTPSDLALWLIELQSSISGKANHVLSVDSVRTMLTPVNDGYALGVATKAPNGRPAISHSGANQGYRCTYFAYQDGDGIVIMTNSDNGDAITMEILGSIAREYHWSDFLNK